MESIPSTESDSLKIIGEHATKATVQVGVLAPRGAIIFLLLSSPVVLVFAILMSISSKPVIVVVQLCTLGFGSSLLIAGIKVYQEVPDFSV